jgi:hypothetical protein
MGRAQGAFRRVWTCGAVAVTSLALAPTAHAALGFQGLSAAPTNANAGTHSDVNVHIGFTSPGDDVKDLTVSLPPGLVGDPTATPLCTVTQLQSDSCPSASQVGTVTTGATAHPIPLLSVPLTVNGSLYNVEPAAGQPARFGIVLRPTGSDPLPLLAKITQLSDVKLRKSDFGLDTVLTNVPNVAHAANGAVSVPIDITSIDIHLSGIAGGKGFMRNPTSCGVKTTKFTADSYAHPNQTATGQASFTSTNCAALPFSPTFTADVGSRGHTQPLAKPPVTTRILQDEGEAGLQNAQVLLPQILNPDIAPLSNPCPVAKFNSNASGCPAKSIIGSASAISPFLPAPETGLVVIVAGAGPADLPRLGVDLHGPLALRLFGSFVFLQAGVGQQFNGLPDIPISNFTLRFKSGGLLINGGNLCSPPKPVFPVTFTGWNGATRTSKVSATVHGCS